MRNPLKPRPAKDVPDAILKGIIRGCFLMALFMCSYSMMAAMNVANMDMSPEFDNPNDNFTMTPVSPVEDLMEKHKCWNGAGPKGVIPSKAIVSPVGKGPKVVHADRGFRIWLEGAPGTLHGFCR